MAAMLMLVELTFLLEKLRGELKGYLQFLLPASNCEAKSLPRQLRICYQLVHVLRGEPISIYNVHLFVDVE